MYVECVSGVCKRERAGRCGLATGRREEEMSGGRRDESAIGEYWPLASESVSVSCLLREMTSFLLDLHTVTQHL